MKYTTKIALTDKNPHVKAIITAIANQRNGDKAESREAGYFYLLRAAHKVDVFEPFCAEQTLLNDLLLEMQAGRESCQYAWELYAKKSRSNYAVLSEYPHPRPAVR